jgi:hypothetical protein
MAAALAAGRGACASYSEKIPATYVSPIVYENLSCKQIAEEASRVSRREHSSRNPFHAGRTQQTISRTRRRRVTQFRQRQKRAFALALRA